MAGGDSGTVNDDWGARRQWHRVVRNQTSPTLLLVGPRAFAGKAGQTTLKLRSLFFFFLLVIQQLAQAIFRLVGSQARYRPEDRR